MKQKQTTIKQTIKPVKSGPDTLHVVYLNDTAIGFVMKMKTTERGCIHPWKAFAMPTGKHEPNGYYGAFYAADGGKKAAVMAVLNNYTQ